MTTEGLVPITRDYLARYYDKYPLPPIPDGVTALAARLRALSTDLAAAFPFSPGESFIGCLATIRLLLDPAAATFDLTNKIPKDWNGYNEEHLEQEASGVPAHKIDENMWKNREQMEEILFLLNKSRRPIALQQKSTQEDAEIVSTLDNCETKLKEMLKKLEQFQLKNADNVFNTVMTYMPQDFRGTLIRQQRERSERSKQAEVDAVVSAGGSIHDRYALLWKQQMDRRVQLAQLGSATGVYKTLVRYLVGVPQVLLDFIRQINDANGPMEVQRERYGPALYTLTKLVLAVRLYLHLSLARYGQKKIEKDDIAVLQQAVVIYTEEFGKFTTFIGEVFVNAPFFISAEDAGADSRVSKCLCSVNHYSTGDGSPNPSRLSLSLASDDAQPLAPASPASLAALPPLQPTAAATTAFPATSQQPPPPHQSPPPATSGPAASGTTALAAEAAPVLSPAEMSSAIRDLTLAVSNLRTFLQAPYTAPPPPPPPAAPFAPPPRPPSRPRACQSTRSRGRRRHPRCRRGSTRRPT
ncbi:hypothetical protein D1007_54829 [Hordeum vulgare]|nr:hypothetical protein D1007_54829 [Hordeum vulgare]